MKNEFRDNMKVLRAAVLVLSLSALAGCGLFGAKVDYKAEAEKSPALEVPPDLTMPAADDHYAVPEGGKEAVASYSEYAKSTQTPACVCKETTAQSAVAAVPVAPVIAPALQDQPDGGKRIVVSEPFDRCWLKVQEALDRAKLAVDDKDRANGLFFLKGGHNQVTVHQAGATCEVAANNGSGATTDETKRIVEQIYKALGK